MHNLIIHLTWSKNKYEKSQMNSSWMFDYYIYLPFHTYIFLFMTKQLHVVQQVQVL
jgi:hypothetical protein